MAPEAQALTSGATGGSKRAEVTVPSGPTPRRTVVLTTTVTLSARGRSARQPRTAAAMTASGFVSGVATFRGGGFAGCPSRAAATATDGLTSPGSVFGAGATARDGRPARARADAPIDTGARRTAGS